MKEQALLLLALCLCISSIAQPDSVQGPIVQPDDPILVMLDELVSLEYIKAVPDISPGNTTEDQTADSLYAQRLEQMDANSPMDLVHNETVQAYIDMYFHKKPELTARMVGLSAHYYPMIEEALDKNNLPQELKHLAVVESALNAQARSRAGAVGLWQFMYSTGKIYGLKSDSYVDQRRDPILATQAACQYLAFLYGLYDDWGLALAAYNAGPGNVNKAIRRSGGKRDYWEIKRWLPRETRGYVPAFIAVNYVMEHYADHGVAPVEPMFKYHELDTLHVKKKVEFDQLSAFVGVDTEQLSYLNPVYRKRTIPATTGRNHLVLPREAIGLFLANEDSIYGFEPEPEVIDGYITEEVTIEHRIRSGEFLGGIAERYGVRVSDLKAWNNIRGTRIYPGKVLMVHKTEKVAVKDKKEDKVAEKPDTPAPAQNKDGSAVDFDYHVVQKGDTLWDIAKKYDGLTVEKLRALNKGVNVRRLSPGQKIKIGVQG